MKIHFIQNGLADLHSHYFQETLAWKDAIQAAGLPWQAYANQSLPPSLAATLDVIPAFPFPPDAEVDPDPVSREVTDLFHLSDAFMRACAAVTDAGIGANDLLLLAYASVSDLYGVARYLHSLPAAHRPHVAFIFHTPDFKWKIGADRVSVTGNFSGWRFAANQLRAQLPLAKIHSFALDLRLAQALSNVLAIPTQLVPIVVSFLDSALLADPSEKIHDVIFPGNFRPERGSELVLEILRILGRDAPNLSVALQVASSADAEHLKVALTAEQNRCRINIAVGNLSHAAYSERLIGSRLVLLPYAAQRYAWRGSGVATEAFGYGIPVVVPAQTWLSDRLEEGSGAGLVFREWNAPAIASAVIAATAALPSLTRAAQARAPQWRKRHEASAALDQILGAVAPTGL